jgi:competence ComEA-like helix-hairpin-helix protein
MNYGKIITVWGAALTLAMAFAFLGAPVGQAQTSSKPQAKAAAPAKIELNKATVVQLSKCPGLTPALAKSIVEYREKSGPFKSTDDLLKVKGMTKDILNKLNPKMEKDSIYITPAPQSSDEDEEEPSLKPSKC